MAREFNRNIFIMMLSIMAGFIIITYFVADVAHQSQIQEINSEHDLEIVEIEENNIYFTTSFLESSVLLDSAREDRAFGNYHFDLAHLFYTSTLSETNETIMEQYRSTCVKNCAKALPKYQTASQNFDLAASFFEKTKNYTDFDSYIELLSLYIDLSNSGEQLTMLRYNATVYLKILAENITFVDNAPILENLTQIVELFNETMMAYGGALQEFEDIQEQIDEYNIEGFNPIREPPI
jgi:hypothetical protein